MSIPKKAGTALLVTAILLSPLAFIYIIGYSDPGSDWFANVVLRNFRIVDVPEGQSALAKGRLILPGDKAEQLKNGDYMAADGREVVKLKSRPKGFFIVTITPHDFYNLDFKAQVERLKGIIDATVRLKADAVVDASAADHIYTYPEGLGLAKRLRKAGIKRLVIFDGGHHVAGLPLEPDGLLVPVTIWKGAEMLDHAYTRDAMDVDLLRDVIKNENLASYMVLFPRLSVTAKTPRGMAGLAAQAFLSANETKPRGTGAHGEANEVVTAPKPIEVEKAAGRSVARKGAIYVWVEIPDEAPPERAIEMARALIAKARIKPERVYVGLTYGISRSFIVDAPPVAKEADVVEKLKKQSPSAEVLSVPFSARDIYERKFLRFE